ncbi:MAG: class I SAM-dependent methyltransferase [Chloroflexi bacterium]|nr:class I SAM-dependent methyltransferase [Chloroflexota bacterium]
MKMNTNNKWPKKFPPLSPEQQKISDDFMAHWHEVLPARFSVIDRFNHEYPVRYAPKDFIHTLEIGAGLGEHLKYEKLNEEQKKNYFCLDLRENMVAIINQNFPGAQAIVHDCQEPLTQFNDGSFDRILAIHVLEHLPNLPATVSEMYRLIDKKKGVFSVVIPCEGSLAYGLARRASAQRIFEKRYKQSYDWFIKREHINSANEIIEELGKYFEVVHKKFFPFPFLPIQTPNLAIGLTLKPKSNQRN